MDLLHLALPSYVLTCCDEPGLSVAVCTVPGLPWSLGSFVPQPSLSLTVFQPLFISQCEHDECLTKFFFINNLKLFGWGQGLFTQRDQVGLCSFQPHVWPVLWAQRWPGTHCSWGNGIPACYSVHDLPAMQWNFFLLCRLIQTHSFSGVQTGDPSTGVCRQENKSFKYCCRYICSCYPGHQVQIQKKNAEISKFGKRICRLVAQLCLV